MNRIDINADDRNHLRELARKCAEIAHLPETEEKTKAWIAHNKCEGYRPMMVVQLNNWDDIGLPLRCTDPLALYFENQLQSCIVAHELIGDDYVTPPYIQVPLAINVLPFGIEKNIIRAEKGPGYHVIPAEENITRFLDTEPKTTYSYDAELTNYRLDFANEIMGDILPAKLVNDSHHYLFTPTMWVTEYMTMEKMYLAIIDEPDALHRLMQTIEQDMIAYLKWQEDNGLLILNNGSDFIASGSYGFSDELPRRHIAPGEIVKTTDIWGHINSQESVGISPEMYKEFVAPYCHRIAEQFGLLYYGCCEAIDTFWDSVSKYPNLRKLSISPWCDEAAMGEVLANSKVIYARKPSPHFVAWQDEFQIDDFREYIKNTARLTRDCKVEYCFLDTCTVHSSPQKVNKMMEIVRQYGAYE